VQIVPGGKPFLYPTDAFTSGRIAGHLVPCLSAVQQVCFHLGYRWLDRTTTTCGYCATGSAYHPAAILSRPTEPFPLRATSSLDPGLAVVVSDWSPSTWTGQALRRLGVIDAAQYLVRPDGHVGYRSRGSNLAGLQQHLARWLPTGPRGCYPLSTSRYSSSRS
jgi:aminoglycoside-2''-adenylyltransferase